MSETPDNRRWYQFSLRTLFVVVTLICVACGLWLGPKARRHSAVMSIVQAGGRVWYADIPANESWPNRTLRGYLPKDWLDDVTVIDLSRRSNANDSVLAGLDTLAGLQAISLYHTKITDEALIKLKGLTGLQSIDLRGTQITDLGLDNLKGLTRLRDLALADTKVTDNGIAELRKALPECPIDIERSGR